MNRRTTVVASLAALLLVLAGCSVPSSSTIDISPDNALAPEQPVVAEQPAAEQPAAEPAAPPAPALSIGQQNAVDKAGQYLAMTAFSRDGLIAQLEFEGFGNADATFAVDHVAPDWNAQAAKKAQQYLDMTSFSRQGLIDQLVFEKFTADQAAAGVAAVGY